jgi:hypothetical protein
MENRKYGYYWVKWYEEWVVAFWDEEDKWWDVIGSDECFIDIHFEEIDETLITRNP